jgi:hypothetical protein
VSAKSERNHKIEYKNVDEIKSAELNPKRHDYDALERSVKRFGFVTPAVENTATGRLVAGHGRIEAVRRIKQKNGPVPKGVRVNGKSQWLVPVVCGTSFTDDEAAAYVAADNRLSEIGGWDHVELDTLLKSLASQGTELLGDIGYTEADLKAIEVEALVGEIPRYTDNDPEKPGGLVDGGPAEPGENGDPKKPSTAMGAEINSEVRRVMLYLTTGQYNRALDLLSKAMVATGAKNHSEVVVALLENAYGSAP